MTRTEALDHALPHPNTKTRAATGLGRAEGRRYWCFRRRDGREETYQLYRDQRPRVRPWEMVKEPTADPGPEVDWEPEQVDPPLDWQGGVDARGETIVRPHPDSWYGGKPTPPGKGYG